MTDSHLPQDELQEERQLNYMSSLLRRGVSMKNHHWQKSIGAQLALHGWDPDACPKEVHSNLIGVAPYFFSEIFQESLVPLIPRVRARSLAKAALAMEAAYRSQEIAWDKLAWEYGRYGRWEEWHEPEEKLAIWQDFLTVMGDHPSMPLGWATSLVNFPIPKSIPVPDRMRETSAAPDPKEFHGVAEEE